MLIIINDKQKAQGRPEKRSFYHLHILRLKLKDDTNQTKKEV